MGGGALGELEHIVLLTVARLGEGAYGVAVHDELVRVSGRELTVPAVYITLGRLEKKGWLASEAGEPTAERGGRAKKYFSVTPEGARLLLDTRDVIDRLWQGVELRPVREGGR